RDRPLDHDRGAEIVLAERITAGERAGNAVDVTVGDAVVNERLAVKALGEILVIRENIGGRGDRDRQGRRGGGGEQHRAHARLSLYIGGEAGQADWYSLPPGGAC